MYKSLIAIIVLFLTTLSCKKSPEPVVPPQQMAAIMEELHLASSISEATTMSYAERLHYKNELIEGILVKNGITREDFYNSYIYYINRPMEIDSIYGSIRASVSAKIDSFKYN